MRVPLLVSLSLVLSTVSSAGVETQSAMELWLPLEDYPTVVCFAEVTELNIVGLVVGWMFTSLAI